MSSALATVKTAALETYVTLCSGDGRRLRSVDRVQTHRCRRQGDETHMRAALAWLCRAHDVGDDDGVSAMFSLVEGWQGSYPETTGYIIPTLFDAADFLHCDEYRSRAAAMAAWLLELQDDGGAFPGSFVGRLSEARVFNTGQIVLGLLRAGADSGDVQFESAAVKAGAWLLARQDADGAWSQSTLGGIAHSYNSRTAWALAQLAGQTGESRFRDAAVANGDWVLEQQDESGWFRHNTFTLDQPAPTLHTIAYTMRGLLEVGALTGESRFVDAADLAAMALYRGWRLYHGIAGAYGRDWQVDSDWRCLPGEAQLALVWLRLDQLLGRAEYRSTAVTLIEGLKATQILDESNPDLYGGLSGSHPINGDYERYCLVSWGPKFLLDAIMLKARNDGECPTA